MTPTQRSILYLRERGWVAEKIEQRLPIPGRFRFVTKDFGGFGDVLACHLSAGIMLVQVTTRDHVNHRADKVTSDTMKKGEALVPNTIRDNLVMWLLAGGRFEVHGWDRGGQTKRWRFRRIAFSYTDGRLCWEDKEME